MLKKQTLIQRKGRTSGRMRKRDRSKRWREKNCDNKKLRQRERERKRKREREREKERKKERKKER